MEQRPHLSVPGLQASAELYPEATADTCPDGCRRLASCVCCCSRVHKSTRIKIVWVLLLAMAASSCVILGCLVFRPDAPFASLSDMRAVTENVDFLFCEGVGVESGGLQFDAYRITGSLKIDGYRRNKGAFQTSLFLESKSFDYLSFYFLENSNLSVYHCSQEPVTFYAFKGKDSFSSWQHDRDCEECYLVKIYIQASADCRRSKFELSIDSTDEYFLVYANDIHQDETWVDIRLDLDRSVYDLTDAVSICIGTSDCLVVLEDRKQTAVYQVASYGDLGQYKHAQFTTKCVPRVWSYLLFHGVFVIVLGVTCSVIIQKFCNNPDSARLWSLQSTERTPLLYGTTSPPSYTNVILNPPKYDDVMRYPPSYSDVTRNMTVTQTQTRQKEADESGSDNTNTNNQ